MHRMPMRLCTKNVICAAMQDILVDLIFAFTADTRRWTLRRCRHCGWCMRPTPATAGACTATCGGAGTRATRSSSRPWRRWLAWRRRAGRLPLAP